MAVWDGLIHVLFRCWMHGEIVEWFGAASDITERKKAEESLKKANEALEEKCH